MLQFFAFLARKDALDNFINPNKFDYRVDTTDLKAAKSI